MKKTITTIFITIVLMLSILFVTPYIFGYRLIYVKEYIFNLEDMGKICGMICGVLGTMGSFIAVMVAIKVPKKVSEQQNKISLFDKKYDTFVECQNYFYDRKFYQTATDKVCGISDIYRKNNFNGDKHALSIKIRLLFSEKTIEIFDKLDKTYDDIHSLESDISWYFNIVQSEMTIKELIDYIERMYHEEIEFDASYNENLKLISNSNEIRANDMEGEVKKYNYYELYSKIESLQLQADGLSKKLTTCMAEEISLQKKQLLINNVPMIKLKFK